MGNQESGGLRELLERKESGSPLHPPRAMDHLALAIIAGGESDIGEALAALSGVRSVFVDWNEARVARVQELSRAFGDGVRDGEAVARKVKDAYNTFFDRKGALNFEFLSMAKPAESKRALSQLLPELGKAAVNLLLYEFCPGASLPLSDEGLKHARRDGAVGKQGDRNQLARALSEQLSLPEAVLLLQYWELEATGTPYGEPLKKESPKKTKKPLPKNKG